MDIYFLGQGAVRIRGKKTTLAVDPFTKIEADAALLTSYDEALSQLPKVNNFRVVISGPGEYEVGGAAILGVGVGGITTYSIKIDGISLFHAGAITRPLTDAEIDKYPNIDIAFLPVVGEIASLIAKLEPKIVIPIYVTKENIDQFLKEVGKEGLSPKDKLTVSREKLPPELEVIWLKA
ncbi:MBL fold metallo-hydrolase [Candidatus Microgenomates bacterium]|nr:MBL fold metallo-hydrolase [Candidatus Microgenomates bacterium]